MAFPLYENKNLIVLLQIMEKILAGQQSPYLDIHSPTL